MLGSEGRAIVVTAFFGCLVELVGIDVLNWQKFKSAVQNGSRDSQSRSACDGCYCAHFFTVQTDSMKWPCRVSLMQLDQSRRPAWSGVAWSRQFVRDAAFTIPITRSTTDRTILMRSSRKLSRVLRHLWPIGERLEPKPGKNTKQPVFHKGLYRWLSGIRVIPHYVDV